MVWCVLYVCVCVLQGGKGKKGKKGKKKGKDKKEKKGKKKGKKGKGKGDVRRHCTCTCMIYIVLGGGRRY